MSRANYYGNSNCVQNTWDNAPKVRGKDPELYRRDAYENVLYRHSHGKDTQMGWNIDHIKPQSKGGSDNPRNLQILQSAKNKSLGNSTKKKSYK